MKQNHLSHIIRLLMALLLLVTSACDNSQNNSSEKMVVSIPASIQKLTLPAGTLRAWITIDTGARVEMTLDRVAGTASASIAGLSFSVHAVLIEYEYTDTINRTLLVASFSRTVDMSSGSTSISIAENQYITNQDDDKDGVSNARELALGTNPFGQQAFPEGCFPLSISTTSGSLVFTFDGDLMFVDGSTDIRLVSHINCTVNSLGSIPGEQLLSVVEDKLRNRIYASGSGSAGVIYELNLGAGTLTQLSDTGVINFSMVLAPASYGAYGNQLIVGTNDGKILAIDQTVANPVPVTITTVSGGLAASLVFASDGTLYAADSSGAKVVTVTADGASPTDFVTGLSFPAGLAIDNVGSRLLVADSLADNLNAYGIPAGNLSLKDSVDFDSVGLPGIAFDNRITLLMITAARQIESHVINAFNTSCLPLAVPGVLTGSASYTSNTSGDLILASTDTDNIYLLKRKDCSFSTLANAVSSGSQLIGLTYDQRQNMIYAGSKNLNIYAVDPSDGSSTLVTAVSGEPNGLAIAPLGYGVYAGQLIVALSNGDLVAIDQTQNSPAPVTIVSTGGQLSDLVFGSDGTLYVADYLADKILNVTSAGVITDFATGLNGPDGLAIDNGGSRLFVASSIDDTLKQVSIPSGVVSVLSSVNFAAGYYPSGLFFDQRSTLLMGVGENNQTITAFSP